jgi:hypothetical protein
VEHEWSGAFIWMIIGSRRIVWMKILIVECMDESNSKTVLTNGNY